MSDIFASTPLYGCGDCTGRPDDFCRCRWEQEQAAKRKIDRVVSCIREIIRGVLDVQPDTADPVQHNRWLVQAMVEIEGILDEAVAPPRPDAVVKVSDGG